MVYGSESWGEGGESPAGPPRARVALLPESGPRAGVCSLLSPRSGAAARGGSLSGPGEARKDFTASKRQGPPPPALLGRGVAGRLAVLERGPGPALRLQEALHERQVVRVPP